MQKFEDPARTIHRDTLQRQQQTFLLDGLSPPPGANGGTGTLRQQWHPPANGHVRGDGVTDNDEVFTGGVSADSGIHMTINPMDPTAGPTVMYRPPSRQSDKVSVLLYVTYVLVRNVHH